MMKYLILTLTILVLFSCDKIVQTRFSEVQCSEGNMPEFDGRKVSFLNENGVAYKDTILDQVEKRRAVFKPCRDYIFEAKFLDDSRELITATRIKMTATGKRWEHQPELQDELIIQYEYSGNDEKKALKYQLNKSLPAYGWIPETKTGIIENVEKIWMHPFRSNQFAFTEVAPFPEVEFPLHVGKKWTGQLKLQEGWGDWENTYGNFTYEIIGKETLNLAFGEIKDCWKIESVATYSFGVSYFDYWFHKELGFVKMNYKNYGDQYLEIELVAVIE